MSETTGQGTHKPQKTKSKPRTKAKSNRIETQTDLPELGLDGRRMRGERSRQKIVSALLALVEEGHLRPSAEDVAKRAGVGLRSVFRHFKDMDSLHQEMLDQTIERVAPLYQVPFKSDLWQEQILEMAARRAKIYEIVMPVKIAADLQLHRSRFIAETMDRLNSYMRTRMIDVLPAALRRNKGQVEAFDLLLSLDAWRRLRHDQGLTPAQSRKAVEAGVRAIMASAQ